MGKLNSRWHEVGAFHLSKTPVHFVGVSRGLKLHGGVTAG